MRSRRAVPPRLLEPPPEVNQGLGIYMKAFWDLCGDRYQAGHRIPWMAVHSWCEANELTGEDEQDTHFLVGRLDMAYLNWVNKKSAKPEKTKNADPRRVQSKHGPD